MTVAGSADLAGRVRPLISSVLPNVELRFLSVAGPVTGTVQGESTEIFSYQVSRKGGDFSVAANADFTPAGYNLWRNIAAVANHLQAAWDAGGNWTRPALRHTRQPRRPGGESAYSAALRQISPSASMAPGARITAGARAFANAALSCPQFEGTTAMLREGECVWATLTGRTASQSGTEGLELPMPRSLQAGGQRALGGGRFLGGSIAQKTLALPPPMGRNSGHGQAGYAAVTAKCTRPGPGCSRRRRRRRRVQQHAHHHAARLRQHRSRQPRPVQCACCASRPTSVGGEELYLRPSMTLSLIHARSSAYRESGAGVLNLEVASASSTVGAMTPALEVGGRVNFANGVVMRLFTSAGVSSLSSGQWSQDSRLVSSPSAARASLQPRCGRIRWWAAWSPAPRSSRIDRLEVRLQYEGEYSANLTAMAGR